MKSVLTVLVSGTTSLEMEVIEKHKEFIASQVNIDDLTEILKFHNALQDKEIQIIRSKETNLLKLQTLINIGFEDINVPMRVLDYLRYSHPLISALVPEIETNHRIRIALEDGVLVFVRDFDGVLCVDIRRYKVGKILFILFWYIKFKKYGKLIVFYILDEQILRFYSYRRGDYSKSEKIQDIRFCSGHYGIRF